MLLWVVYIVRGFTPRLSLRFYVGSVRVLDGETWEQALERRRQEHSGPRKRALWLYKICEGLGIPGKSVTQGQLRAWTAFCMAIVKSTKRSSIRAVIRGMPKRFDQCIAAGGGPIGK